MQRVSGHEFSVAHYTGKVTYDCRDMADKNRDFLPPEMVSVEHTRKKREICHLKEALIEFFITGGNNANICK